MLLLIIIISNNNNNNSNYNNSNNGDTSETTEIEQVHPRNWKAKGLNGQLLLEEEMPYIESSHVKSLNGFAQNHTMLLIGHGAIVMIDNAWHCWTNDRNLLGSH